MPTLNLPKPTHLTPLKETLEASFTVQACHFALKCGGVRLVNFINVEVIVESSRSLRNLPWRTSCFLEFCL